jgi:hypothetical protein
MSDKRKTKLVAFRVSDAEYELLQDAAKARGGLSEGATARIVLLEALSGFDQKQEYVHRRLDQLDAALALILTMTSLGAAAGTLPLDAEQQDAAALREKLKTHFKHSKSLGDNLVKMLKDGKL